MKLINAMHSGSAGFRNLKVGAVCLFMVFAGGALSTASPQAAAQQAAAALEEVIVTARKRAESLQDVPVSVTAFTESALKQAGIESMQELSDFTPGFDFAQAFGRQDFRPAIRGQSTIQGGANAGLFIDGFFIGDGAPTVPYAALERVEVAKGPQSALYGRSTLAGAINYILKRPTEDYEGVLEVGVGEDSEFRTELTFSGPLGGNAGFMVSFSGYQYDGQYTNRFRGFPGVISGVSQNAAGQDVDANDDPFVRGAGKSVNVGEEETFSVVALLEYEISDRIKITGRLMKEETDDGPYGIAIQSSERNNCAFGADAPYTRPSFTGGGSFLRSGPYRGSGYYCGEVDVEDILDNEYDNKLNLDTGFFDLGVEYDATRLSGTLEYDLDWAMLTVNAAWHDYDSRAVQDQTFGPATPGRGDASQDQPMAVIDDVVARTALTDETVNEYQFDLYDPSQGRGGSITDGKEEINETQFELRLASSEDQPLRWTGGVYWYSNETEAEGRDSQVSHTAVTTLSVTAINAPGAGNLMFTGRPDTERTNWAVFASMEYDLSDVLTLGLEVRYNEEEVEISDILYCDNDPTNNATECPNNDAFTHKRKDFSETYDETLYRLTLDYRFNKDLLIYGVLASGNKPGNFNSFGTRPLLLSQIPVEESTAIMYELGLKASAWDGRLHLAAAAYQTDWEDQQLTVTTAAAHNDGGSTSILDNLGETKIRGIEMELEARLTDFWDLRLAYAYTDTEIKEYDVEPYFVQFVAGSGYAEASVIFDGVDRRDPASRCSPFVPGSCPVIDASGGELPQVSKNQLSLSNTFNGVLANGMNWYVRVDYLHRSKRYAQVYNLAHTGESDLIHFRAGLSLDALAEQFLGGGGLEVALWGRNLTDDQTSPALIRYIENLTNFGPKRAIGFTLPEQQHFGVDLTYRF